MHVWFSFLFGQFSNRWWERHLQSQGSGSLNESAWCTLSVNKLNKLWSFWNLFSIYFEMCSQCTFWLLADAVDARCSWDPLPKTCWNEMLSGHCSLVSLCYFLQFVGNFPPVGSNCLEPGAGLAHLQQLPARHTAATFYTSSTALVGQLHWKSCSYLNTPSRTSSESERRVASGELSSIFPFFARGGSSSSSSFPLLLFIFTNDSSAMMTAQCWRHLPTNTEPQSGKQVDQTVGSNTFARLPVAQKPQSASTSTRIGIWYLHR